MYATTFFTFEGDGSEILGDLRSRLELRVARRARDLVQADPDEQPDVAWQRAEDEVTREVCQRDPAS